MRERALEAESKWKSVKLDLDKKTQDLADVRGMIHLPCASEQPIPGKLSEAPNQLCELLSCSNHCALYATLLP